MSIRRLILMSVFNFIAMFVLMYSMVNIWGNVYLNINKAYMAGLMTAPMVFLEGLFMGSMYQNKKALYTLMGMSAIVLIAIFLFARQQAFVYDKQFLRSMIPHHSSAILMCQKAKIKDNEIKELCKSIISSQQSEIDQMNEILKRLNK